MVLEASCARLDRLDSWKRNTATVKHWLCREANVDNRAKEMAEDKKKGDGDSGGDFEWLLMTNLAREARACSLVVGTSARCNECDLSKESISIVFIGRAYSPARSTGKQHDGLVSGHLLNHD